MWFSFVLQCREVSWDGFPAASSSIASCQLRHNEAGYHVGYEPCQENDKALTPVAIDQCGEGCSIDQAMRTEKHQLSEFHDTHSTSTCDHHDVHRFIYIYILVMSTILDRHFCEVSRLAFYLLSEDFSIEFSTANTRSSS